MPSYKEVLKTAKTLARKAKKEPSAVELLLLHFSELEPSELYLKFTDEMPKEIEMAFFEALSLYLEKNKPVQQIIGFVYFYGYKFKVKNTALIPRFETEELVANTLIYYDEYFANKAVDVVDIGTGSGCLAITLAKEEPLMKVTATDISESALLLAKENAEALNVQVNFLLGDMVKPLIGNYYDIIISNPPYIPLSEDVDPLIYDNEPHIALFGGEDGLDYYREIIKESKAILKPQAMIAFEHAYDKKMEIHMLAKQYYPEAQVFTLKDMQNKDRMTFIFIGF